jgi:cell division protein FtsI (penicillin-binding protein 3)
MIATTLSAAISSGRVELVNDRQRSLLTAKWRVVWVLIGFALLAPSAGRSLTATECRWPGCSRRWPCGSIPAQWAAANRW